MKKAISVLLLFIIIFTNSISVFASGSNELHFMRSRVDTDNKTIKLDILKSEEPKRSSSKHNEAIYGDYSFLKTDNNLKYTIPELELYHSNYNTERNFDGLSFPNGDKVKVNDRGIAEFAGKGDHFIFSFPSDGESSISSKEKRFAKEVVATMNDSIDKLTKAVTRGNGFKTKDEFLQFWSDFVSTNEREGTITIGNMIYNYYIGNPNGTTYNKETEKLTTKNSMFYNYDKDEDGNIMMYVWTGDKNLNSMKEMDFLNVSSFVYAIPNIYHTSELSNSEKLKGDTTEYYTIRMFAMQALLNYKLKYESVAENTVEVTESKWDPTIWISKMVTSGINTITSWLISFANTYEIVTYKFLTIEFFRYINPIILFMTLILILLGVFLFGFYIMKFTWTTIINNVSLHIKNLQSFKPLMNYLLMSGLTLAFLTPTIFFSRELGLMFFDILPTVEIFTLGTADTVGGAFGELIIAILFTIIAYLQLSMFIYGVLYALFGPLILIDDLKAGRTNYSYIITTVSYLLFIPFSTLLFTLVLGITNTLAFNNWIMIFLGCIVGIPFLKELVGKLGLTGLSGMLNTSNKILGYGSEMASSGAMVAGAVAGGGQGAGARGSRGHMAGSLAGASGGLSSNVSAGSSIGGANDLDQTIATNSNNLGAMQSMERAGHVGVFGSMGNTFNEFKDSISREYTSHLEDIKAGKEYRGKEFKENRWNKTDAFVRTASNVAKAGTGKVVRTGAGALSAGLSFAGGAMGAGAGLLGGDTRQFGRGLSQMNAGAFEAVDGIKSGIQGAKEYVSHANASQEFKKHISPINETIRNDEIVNVGGAGGLEGVKQSTHDPDFKTYKMNMETARQQGFMGMTTDSNGSIYYNYDYYKASPEDKKNLDILSQYQRNGNHRVLKDMGINSVELDANNKVKNIQISNIDKVHSHMGVSKMTYEKDQDQLWISRNERDISNYGFVPKVSNDPDYIPPVNKYNYKSINSRQNYDSLTTSPNNPSIGPTSPIKPPHNPLNDLKPMKDLKPSSDRVSVKPPNISKKAN